MSQLLNVLILLGVTFVLAGGLRRAGTAAISVNWDVPAAAAATRARFLNPSTALIIVLLLFAVALAFVLTVHPAAADGLNGATQVQSPDCVNWCGSQGCHAYRILQEEPSHLYAPAPRRALFCARAGRSCPWHRRILDSLRPAAYNNDSDPQPCNTGASRHVQQAGTRPNIAARPAIAHYAVHITFYVLRFSARRNAMTTPAAPWTCPQCGHIQPGRLALLQPLPHARTPTLRRPPRAA